METGSTSHPAAPAVGDTRDGTCTAQDQPLRVSGWWIHRLQGDVPAFAICGYAYDARTAQSRFLRTTGIAEIVDPEGRVYRTANGRLYQLEGTSAQPLSPMPLLKLSDIVPVSPVEYHSAAIREREARREVLTSVEGGSAAAEAALLIEQETRAKAKLARLGVTWDPTQAKGAPKSDGGRR